LNGYIALMASATYQCSLVSLFGSHIKYVGVCRCVCFPIRDSCLFQAIALDHWLAGLPILCDIDCLTCERSASFEAFCGFEGVMEHS
jgi:hypothetical protein